jgi:putative oxidoreductase
MNTSTASFSGQKLTSQASNSRAALWTRALATDASWSPLALRAALAVVMFPHGAQKALGWWGGYGLEGTLGFFTQQVGLPYALALFVIGLELLGPVLLVLGLGTRAVAAGFVALMVGAIATTHAQHGFFMNWFGQQKGEGFE